MKASAAANHRSLNAEIVVRLEQSSFIVGSSEVVEPAGEEEPGSGDLTFAAEPAAPGMEFKPKPKPARTSMCVHRVGADAFCRICDG